MPVEFCAKCADVALPDGWCFKCASDQRPIVEPVEIEPGFYRATRCRTMRREPVLVCSYGEQGGLFVLMVGSDFRFSLCEWKDFVRLPAESPKADLGPDAFKFKGGV